MRLNRVLALANCTALIGLLSMAAVAQKSTTTTAPVTQHKGMLSRMMGHLRKPGVGQGNIIGNKNTKVYHLPGDKGTLPAEKNRVYFRSESEAQAAGYHLSGQKGATTGHHSKMRSGSRGSSSHMNGHLPK